MKWDDEMMRCRSVLLHAAVGLVAVLMASTLSAAPETVVISFERSEGFPAAGGKFSGASAPKGVVTKWTNDSSARAELLVDGRRAGRRFLS